MKPLSIKTKITVWYTGLIVLILCIILGILAFSTDRILVFELQRELEDEVYDIVEDIQYVNGTFDFHKLKYFDDGISISIYNREQVLIKGLLPSGFSSSVPLHNNQIQTIQSGEVHWLVYDLYVSTNWPEALWIRGIVSLNASYETRTYILLICVILFPFLALLAAFGGWLITQKAFQPVSLIRKTAADIENSGDLSKRIQLSGSKDEIDDLAQTFDHMLDQLELSFQKERQFTSDASHELRTPLSVILAHTEYGLTQRDNPAETADVLQVIQQQAKKMMALVSSLLLLARTDHQSAQLDFETVNLSEIANMVIDELMITAQSKNITIHTAIDDNLIILADQTSIMRLLLNLLQNAIRYGRQNGWIKVELHQLKEDVLGSIEDNGIGIASDDLPQIWNRFYQVDPSRKSVEDTSAGLGLSIVKWIIEIHDGQISVESLPGQGTLFRFSLPNRPRHYTNKTLKRT
ncbi:sensor histidine kinase [Pelosinus fermentans]|uniref:histidine kinase n=1 Tax=Pelosinus fermentans JBW45 TaxID=1192197 RepID=I8TXD8_9FIRM|nr:ATP-binding protein [Pelosinus fermentans]AJQ29717.1 integral membrane sensor signal transduction histidine kinase [Pelosinus fermentans JBW45]